jgi:hypothetical protein
MQKILHWFLANKLAVNVSKCKYIIFHNKGKKIPENPKIIFNYNVGNQQDPNLQIPIERIMGDETYKYLGVLIDENFNLNRHTDFICNKLSRALFCMNRVQVGIAKKIPKKPLFCPFQFPFTILCKYFGGNVSAKYKKNFNSASKGPAPRTEQKSSLAVALSQQSIITYMYRIRMLSPRLNPAPYQTICSRPGVSGCTSKGGLPYL